MKKMMTLMLLALAALLMMTGCAKEKDDASMIGVWALTGMTGSQDAEESFAYYESIGVKVTMAISSDTIEMVSAQGEHTEYEVISYRIEGNMIITDASQMEYVLDGDTLKLTTQGVTMVFTRR